MVRSPFPYSDTDKRYHTYDYYLRHTYGSKCARIPLDGGFSCPNRERGGRGCTYCSSRGSGDFCADLPTPREQFMREYARLSEKWGKRLPAIPYFQAFSSTYADVSVLRACYEDIFSYTDETGAPVPLAALCIATRPDCLPDETVSYLAELNGRIPVTVELGLQSAHDVTLRRINRGHDLACFDDAFDRLRAAGISVCVHIIDGLPGEDDAMMLATASYLGGKQPDFVKIHMLHLLRDTVMAEEYTEKPFPLLSRDDYISVVCRQLTRLPEKTVICRLTGDGARDQLIAPLWTVDKKSVLGGIDRYMKEHGLFQGCALQPDDR